jgi:hypothetical protein
VEYIGIKQPRSEVQQLPEDAHPQSNHIPDVQVSISYTKVFPLGTKTPEVSNSKTTRTDGTAPGTPTIVVVRFEIIMMHRSPQHLSTYSNLLVITKTDICVAETISIIFFFLELDDFLRLWLLQKSRDASTKPFAATK